jgi:hypothetical protein
MVVLHNIYFYAPSPGGGKKAEIDSLDSRTVHVTYTYLKVAVKTVSNGFKAVINGFLVVRNIRAECSADPC